jgi:hypothetical protein
MNRYLLGLLALIGLLVFNNVIDGRKTLRNVTRTSRTAVTANPTSAATSGVSLEQAGRSVTRQTSIEGIERSRQLGTGTTTQSNTTSSDQFGGSSDGFTTTAPATVTPVTPVVPVTPTPSVVPITPVTPGVPGQRNPDAIPALW